MFYEKRFRFRLLKKSNASEFVSASSFFKVIPLPQIFNRFQIPGSNSILSVSNMKLYRTSVACKLLYMGEHQKFLIRNRKCYARITR